MKEDERKDLTHAVSHRLIREGMPWLTAKLTMGSVMVRLTVGLEPRLEPSYSLFLPKGFCHSDGRSCRCSESH